MSDKPLNEWFGITTKIKNNQERVISITLPANNLNGILSEDIGFLTESKAFDLGYNELSGDIPTTFINLSKLEILSLRYNI